MKTSEFNWRDVRIETINRSDFPECLRSIEKCPQKLYYRGVWDPGLFEKALAVVGSRRVSRYGRDVIDKFVPELVGAGITVISGFMYGVDAMSHSKCMEFGGKTIAVLGCGLNVLNPVENDGLYSQILETGGLVISEYEPDFQPTLWTFPQRNRIVAGLANKGVLVIEAGIKSGSLITARIAREQGKKIWSVPGPITSSVSEGTNWLIQNQWAEIITSPAQITQIERNIVQESLFENSLPKDQQAVYDLLKIEPLTTDEIARKLKQNISQIGLCLSMMTLSDLINEENGRIYLKK